MLIEIVFCLTIMIASVFMLGMCNARWTVHLILFLLCHMCKHLELLCCFYPYLIIFIRIRPLLRGFLIDCIHVLNSQSHLSNS
jgi:hypothetical protein